MRRASTIRQLAGGLLLLWLPLTAWAQPTPAAERLKVFIDCDECFRDYLQEEIQFVDLVRDPADANVHVIITNADTSADGVEYSADFIGRGALAAMRRSLRTTTMSGEVDDVVRRQIASMVSGGLLSFVAVDSWPANLTASIEVETDRGQAGTGSDPWNRWIFSLRGSGSFEGEESQREFEASGAVSADRITPDWKITLGGQFEQRNQRFEVDEGKEVVAEVRERDMSGLVVKSLGEHWSAGFEGEVGTDTFENQRFDVELAPGVEFNVFPYAEYTRRQLRLQYWMGMRHAEYFEVTLYGKTEETHPVHIAAAAFERTERWGSLDTRLEWSQYLHDLSLSRLEAEGEVSWRLARGLSLTVEGSISRLRDQIGLPRRGATEEEVLLEQRQLQSRYEYGLSFGVTYTFGSIFSAIVNPRFGQ